MTNLDVKLELIRRFNLTPSDFDSHESDLYVRYRPEIYMWLKEFYLYWQNITTFMSPINNTEWMEIPFANITWWENRIRSKDLNSSVEL